ncbi:type II toxin-antitoxin system RelE/ParE family toxin [Pseudomonas machongensis]|uniref:type II toxin-antitoxin system RelE/ParE family toxin n=1 Tax=Pseudomonas putida TaxID=303 RepID=UPI001561D5F3|nr:type II toxin-antitoxin system RelE/ParE family toxin [Pseudomonas putida]
MIHKIQQTKLFSHWLINLRDNRAKLAVGRRIERMAAGNFGNMKSLGCGLHELRIDVGAGYRVYFTRRYDRLIVLLAGGDKSSQTADILLARKMAKELK